MVGSNVFAYSTAGLSVRFPSPFYEPPLTPRLQVLDLSGVPAREVAKLETNGLTSIAVAEDGRTASVADKQRVCLYRLPLDSSGA